MNQVNELFIKQNGDIFRKGLIKSFWFKSFSHVYFDSLWDFYYKSCSTSKSTIKSINKGLISNYLTERGLAYWIILLGDGSLNKKINDSTYSKL